MDRSEIASLIAVSYETDSIGQQVPVETKREVFCNIGSVSWEEKLEAWRLGLEPQIRLTMFRYDYGGESAVELSGRRYGVYRTYLGKNETIELYLEGKAGVYSGKDPSGPDR